MATTFSTAKTSLDEISSKIQTNRQRFAQAKALLATAEAELANMSTQYGAIVNDIDAAVTAAPGDAAWINAKAEKDKLVAEFQALKTTVADAKNALSAYTI